MTFPAHARVVGYNALLVKLRDPFNGEIFLRKYGRGLLNDETEELESFADLVDWFERVGRDEIKREGVEIVSVRKTR